MYFKESDIEEVPAKSFSGFLGVMISVLLIIALGIFPGSLLNLITSYL